MILTYIIKADLIKGPLLLHTEKEIKIWAETHLTADEYMELFEVEE